ncbi:heavy metal sensor histidine kinase [Paraburkholderia fungorum]|jgi:two-component system heavy metal sensor histidine kinase CusS|uniref:Sensor protein n=1 Tax=Paraburkholderia fungorum TaxID=134537 RepID=A0AAP5QGA1_9BURK|nr:heavy metal sensor histidine kinase [Paraburkholderia fungorum]MBU7440379.1 heavy metal sensor histidine kinase [Paraburkholderia fungorum]MDT8841672.1 heavy metal sensor histidine kinase [Paraburkholderia fungorum]PRZ53149.1 two-component system heavy metal sensor histidine kinase CusS [Paraburkholderia fungorum]
MTLWTDRSLTARTTVLFAAIACVVIGTLGAYFYHSAQVSLERRADVVLTARVEHFSRIVRDLYSVSDLKSRPVLFESMLGAEEDVLLFRRPGEAPFIDVNPAGLAVPALHAGVQNRLPTLPDIRQTLLPDGVPVHWAIAAVKAREDGSEVEVIAAHPMTQEMRMLAAYRNRIVLATLTGMLAATLLAYYVLRRTFRPVREIATRAAQISPASLSVRLDSEAAPLELRQLTHAFNAMLDRLADGFQRLSQFSADLAHEIRTPVGALIGQTQVTLAKTRDADEYQQVLESNLEELNRLSHIAENILFLAHADHAALSIEREPVDLHDELVRIADYFEGPADERGMRFTVEAMGIASANPMLCRRAINNLVVNAVRYGANNTVVRLSGTQDEQGATVVVENDGAPIPDEQLNRLFDRFYRADAARSAFTESSGLGLAIVRAIMHLHGGTARVVCPVPGVVRFELRFPGV